MNKKLKLLFIACISVITSSFYTKKDDDRAFDEILIQVPFGPLTDSIRNEPGNPELYFKRAVLLNSNNFPEPALDDFRKAWVLEKQEKYAYGLGNLLLEKKPDSAIIFLQEAIVHLPNSFLLPLTLSHAHLAKGNINEALKVTNELLVKNPEQTDVLKMKAEILSQKGDQTGSIAALETAYQVTPGDIELNYMLALRLAESGSRRVLTLCDSLIKADSLGLHAEPYYYKGIYFSAIKDKQQALSFFDQAIKRDYNFLDGYIEKGAVLFDLKKYTEALAVFNLCLTVSPKYADAYYWIAKCQEQTGKKDQARLNYERAYSLDKKLAEAKAAADKLK